MKYLFALLLFAPGFVLANTPKKTLVILMDISGSSPLADGQAQKRLWQSLQHEVLELPIGSTVQVRTVANEQETVFSQTYVVQNYKTREGDTSANLAKRVPADVVGFYKSGRSQGGSSLVNSIWDASKLCSDSCTIFFATDGFENANGVNYPADFKKPLPTFKGLDLSGVDVKMMGVGLGLDSDPTTRIEVENRWSEFLKKHHANSVNITRF